MFVQINWIINNSISEYENNTIKKIIIRKYEKLKITSEKKSKRYLNLIILINIIIARNYDVTLNYPDIWKYIERKR